MKLHFRTRCSVAMVSVATGILLLASTSDAVGPNEQAGPAPLISYSTKQKARALTHLKYRGAKLGDPSRRLLRHVSHVLDQIERVTGERRAIEPWELGLSDASARRPFSAELRPIEATLKITARLATLRTPAEYEYKYSGIVQMSELWQLLRPIGTIDGKSPLVVQGLADRKATAGAEVLRQMLRVLERYPVATQDVSRRSSDPDFRAADGSFGMPPRHYREIAAALGVGTPRPEVANRIGSITLDGNKAALLRRWFEGLLLLPGREAMRSELLEGGP